MCSSDLSNNQSLCWSTKALGNEPCGLQNRDSFRQAISLAPVFDFFLCNRWEGNFALLEQVMQIASRENVPEPPCVSIHEDKSPHL